jgi:hypothetical protein
MTTVSETMSSSSSASAKEEVGLDELEDQFEELRKKYRQYLPKVDPALLDDLLLRQMENPHVTPMYMVEVFTKPDLNTEEVREYIISKTGMSPAIYDNGTHYATNQKLTLEMLKEISDSEEVIEVTGDYTGGLGGYGASHEHRTHENWQELSRAERSSEKQASPAVEVSTGQKKNDYRIAAYVAAGIVGAIALAGFIISGGMLPNANVSQAIPAGTEPGVLHGYVNGPIGLPAVGATVMAVQQGDDFYASSFVSVNGQYYIDLPPGEYIVYVAFPDGTSKVAASELQIERGTAHELEISY